MRGIIDIDNHPNNIDLERDLLTGTFNRHCQRLVSSTRLRKGKPGYDDYNPNNYDVLFEQELDLKVLIM